MAQIEYIKLEKLFISEFDGRLEVDQNYIIELSESIKELTVMEPIIIRRKNGKFEIVFGSCRYRASKLAGLDAMPCIIVKADDELAEKMKLHENLKRLPLSHIDQALTFSRLISVFKMTEVQISKLSGKSVPYISQHITLLGAGEELINAVQDEEINFSVARELMHVKKEKTKLHLLKYAIEGGAKVEVVQNWVQEANRDDEYLAQDNKKEELAPPPVERPINTFGCNTCETPTDICKMMILRVCPECNNAILSEIQKAKKEAQSNIPQVNP